MVKRRSNNPNYKGKNFDPYYEWPGHSRKYEDPEGTWINGKWKDTSWIDADTPWWKIIIRGIFD